MRVQIEFDDNGTIRSVAYPTAIKFHDGSEGVTGRMASPGYHMIEEEVAEIQHERDLEGVQKVMKSYHVTGHPQEPRLTPR